MPVYTFNGFQRGSGPIEGTGIVQSVNELGFEMDGPEFESQ